MCSFIFLDTDEAIKQAKAKVLVASLSAAALPTILIWQFASELLNWLRKREAAGRVSSSYVEPHLRDLQAVFPLTIPSPQLFAHYFDLFSRFSLSHWDAMLLAACKEAGVTTLYSEDMDSGTDYDGLIIINPFVGGH